MKFHGSWCLGRPNETKHESDFNDPRWQLGPSEGSARNDGREIAWQTYDNEAYAKRVRSAVADVVRKQVECGVDDVPDGEQGKAGFNAYDEPCMRRASSGVCYIYFNNFHVCNAVSVFEVGARRNYLPGHLYSREVRED